VSLKSVHLSSIHQLTRLPSAGDELCALIIVESRHDIGLDPVPNNLQGENPECGMGRRDKYDVYRCATFTLEKSVTYDVGIQDDELTCFITHPNGSSTWTPISSIPQRTAEIPATTDVVQTPQEP